MMLLPFLVPIAAAADDTTYHLAQARQFARNKWYEDAAAEVEAGLATAAGGQSYELHWLGAQVYYELDRIDRARELAADAVALAPSEAALAEATGFRDYLLSTFGGLTVSAPYPGIRTRLQLEPASTQLDPDLKRLINKVALELRDPTDLPVTVWLPEGDYLVNGHPARVGVAGDGAHVALELREIGARGLAALQVTRLEVSLGTAVYFGEDVANLRPGGAVELALTQPFGPVLLGVLVGWDARAYVGGQAETVFDPMSFEGGLRVGRELVLGGPLAVRPSLGARYGLVPGLALRCETSPSGAVCPASDGADVALYVPGHALSPFAELVVEYREAGRSTALGVGVKAVVAQAFGATPASGVARFEDGTELAYEGPPQPWTATTIRLYTNLDLAF